jgi:ATP-dependent RNA helicase DHX36
MHTRGAPRERGRSGFRGSFKEQRMHTKRLRERNVDSEIDILRDTLGNSYCDGTLEAVSTLMDYSDGSVPLELVALLLECIDDTFGEGAVLVFLPGWEEISRLHEMLVGDERRFANPRQYLLLPLHSSMPTANQSRIFDRPPPGVRKIVLATNIAETSLTIDDVVYVIDSGRFKEKTYDAATNVACLRPEWVSKASARQRRGRAGRVQEGVCYHLFSSQAHSNFKEFQEPEMLRAPLESLCLRVKSMRVPSIEAFLKRALEPPDSRAVKNALVMLRVIGALQPDTEELTPLGNHLANIPVDPRLGKMLLYAVMFQCLDPILTIASSLGFRNPFTMPLNEKNAADRAKRVLADGKQSDHAAVLCAYNRWRDGGGQRFARQFYLSHPTLLMIDDMKSQFISILSDAGFIPRAGSNANLNLNAKNWPLVKGVLVAGLFPSVARVNFGRNRVTLFTRNDGVVKVHPGSVNNMHPPNYSHRWTVFYEKVRSTAIFLLDVSEVTPMALCLFGGPIELSTDKKRITIETGDGQIGSAASLPEGASRRPWVMFENSGDAGELVLQLREQMDAALLRELSDPGRSEFADSHVVRRGYVDAVKQLLEEAEKQSFHNIK